VVYDARWLFLTGFFPGLAISAAQISIFYLGIERIFCIFIPTEQSVNRKFIFTFGCISSQLLLVVVSVVLILPDYPQKPETHCRAMNCIVAPERARMYLLYRSVFSFINTIIGIIIYVSVKRKLGNGDAKQRKGLTTRLAITTFFCEFAFDFVPHSTIAIIGLTGKSYFKSLGPFSLFFGSLDIGLCAILYQWGFVRLRRALDKKAAIGTRFDAIDARRPTMNVLEDLRF
ncbi:hypothetical protein FO519_008398, partial [Halicephalobus sp. NKZ332]